MKHERPMMQKPAFLIGLALSLLWGGLGLLSVNTADVSELSKLQILMGIVAFLLPIALIWMAVFLSFTIQTMRKEAAFLRQSMDRMHFAVTGGSVEDATRRAEEIKQQLDTIAEMTKTNDTRLAAMAEEALAGVGKLAPVRQAAAMSLQGGEVLRSVDQPDLPLSSSRAPLDEEPLSVEEFLKALNFPEDPDDREGFRVLHRALNDREIGGMLDKAKNLLSSMAEDGVYMDDLDPDLPPARSWRAFVKGVRGPQIAALGGIRDKSALSLVRARVKNDVPFRDMSHEFLRGFDRVLMKFEKTAEDVELQHLGQTRTACLFMLLGRVSGTFD